MKNIYRRLHPRCLQEKNTSVRAYIVLLLITLCTMTLLWEAVTELMQSELLRCYNQGGNVLPVLQDAEVPPGEAFFFHETSCEDEVGDTKKDIRLNARQACAVESAAYHHPDNLVFLLIAAPVKTDLNSTSNKVVQALLQYSNIKIRHINVNSYLESTPLSGLYGALRRSRWPVSHTSDVLRYATLLKFRGTYMDLDVIVLRPLLFISNFVGAESGRSLGAGVINFGPDAVGKEMAEECALELQRTFDGSDWGMNGPGVITRVLHRKCNVSSVGEMQWADCHGFHVLPVPAFYAFPFWEASMFFRPGKLEQAQRVLNSSLVIHFWNKVTSSYGFPVGNPDVPFLHYAGYNCPKVYKSVNGNF